MRVLRKLPEADDVGTPGSPAVPEEEARRLPCLLEKGDSNMKKMRILLAAAVMLLGAQTVCFADDYYADEDGNVAVVTDDGYVGVADEDGNVAVVDPDGDVWVADE